MPLPDLEELDTLGRPALRVAWRAAVKRSPPPRMSQVFMRRVLAFEIQAQKSGGLSKALVRDLSKAPGAQSATVRITLSGAELARLLERTPSELAPSLLRIDAPFHCRRRGAEMKIIAGDLQPAPDRTLVRALRNAHAWVRQMKACAAIRQVALKADRSENYVARILPLAFLSPRIQQAIMAGTQPVPLTLEILAGPVFRADGQNRKTCTDLPGIPDP